MFISDLDELKDILDTLLFEEEPSIFDETAALELVETALHLMDEFISFNPHIISEPDFLDILLEEVTDLFYIQMEDHIENLYNGDDIEDDMNDLIQDSFYIFINTFYPDKLDHIHNTNDNNRNNDIDDQEINFIEEKCLPLIWL